MIQGIRVALTAAIVAVLLHIGAPSPANAELSADMLDRVRATINQDPGPGLTDALRDLFAAYPDLAPEIAAAVAEFNPGLSRACALAAARAVPDRILDVVAAMVAEAPERAQDVVDGVSEALPGRSQVAANVAARAAVQAAAGPAGPVSRPEDTTSGSDDRSSAN